MFEILIFLFFCTIITYLIVRTIYTKNEKYLADYDKMKWCKCKMYKQTN
jgi:hypothetical protein